MSKNSFNNTIVISAVNFSEGGPLTVMNDFIETLSRLNNSRYRIVVLTHSSLLIKNDNIEAVEFPQIKNSWFKRLYFEYFLSKKISKKYKPKAWISLHDITPNVIAEKQYVYCHNPSMFYKGPVKNYLFDYKFLVFRYLYYFLYRVNIYRNSYVFVQQEWIRNEFNKLMPGLPIAVTHPLKSNIRTKMHSIPKNNMIEGKTYFFLYPSLPRVFKNFEVLIHAFNEINEDEIFPAKVKLLLTIDGNENKYSKYIKKLAMNNSIINFIGRQCMSEMETLYKKCDIVLFSSYLETWGLPISEAKSFKKPILLSNLPYAKEALGEYSHSAFFEPDNYLDLVKLIKDYILGKEIFTNTKSITYATPFLKDWDETAQFILNDIKSI